MFYTKLKERQNISDPSNLTKRYREFKGDYDLIEKLKLSNNTEAFISKLTISEFVHSLSTEVIAEKLYNEGLPLSSWPIYMRDVHLSKDESDDLLNTVMEFIQNETDVTPKKQKSRIKVVDNDHDHFLIGELLLKYEILTQDAILLSTAIKYNYDFFVTSDKRLLKCSKNIPKSYLNKLQIISSQTALTKF